MHPTRTVSIAALALAILWGLVEFAALCRSRWALRRRRDFGG